MKTHTAGHILASIAVFLVLTGGSLAGCGSKEKQVAVKHSRQNISPCTIIQIDVREHPIDALAYNPSNNLLHSISREGSRYHLKAWQEKVGWSTVVASWKIKKNEILDNFVYNATGALFACRKSYRKNRLRCQDIVHLHPNGRIQSLSLTDPDQGRQSSGARPITEIADIQCCGNSLAVTYQYGAVRIYNIVEGQALGADNIIGTASHNLLYDLHYITITKDRESHEVLLQDYDMQTGELTRSFPLGGNGQDSSDFYLSCYQDELYLLSVKGVFSGACTQTILTKQLTCRDLLLPDNYEITYWQAARDQTLYIGYKTPGGDLRLQHIALHL